MRDFSILTTNSKRKYYKSFNLLIIYIFKFYKLSKNKEIKEENLIQPKISTILKEYIKKTFSILKEIYSLEYSYYNNTIIEVEYNNKSLKLEELITNNILSIIELLLEQPTSQISLEEFSIFNSPIITYLALKSINSITKVSKEASLIEQESNYLIYMLRLYSLAIINRKAIELNNSNNPSIIDSIFTTFYNKNLTNKSNNCFKELTQIRVLTRKIATNTMPKARIINLGNNTLAIDSKELYLPNLSIFFNNLQDRLEEILFSKLLLLNPSNLEIDISKLKDNIYKEKNNFNFTNYKLNNLDNSKLLLIKRLEDKESRFSKEFIKGYNNNRPIYNISRFNLYLKEREEFIKLLGVAIYLLTGCPIRGIEIIQIKYINTLLYRTRNLFIDNNSSYFRVETNYSKSNNITSIDKSIIRFLSPKLSSILKVYLVYIIPFYNFITIKIKENKEILPYLLEYNNKLLTSTQISNLLGLETLKYLGIKLIINSYRYLFKY